ncbi:cytochrome P450 [Apodospora peruviana]|uniref:Cytochrome P450 n=1 Tax=Apodospora peruviana TaxID=516989 RepID=A0AAE0HY74_9PEZI|nr:cytochrome P450 [Apodospora peruviana]
MASSPVAGARDNTATMGGGLAALLLENVAGSPNSYLTIFAIPALLFFFRWVTTPSMSAREPPLVKPTIPVIGHIIHLLGKEGAFYTNIYKKTPMPIATLPLANHKIYFVTSPSLIQASLKNKNLSFDPFMVEFGKLMLGFSDAEWNPLVNQQLVDDFVRAIHGAMLGEHLHKMNATALKYIAERLDQIGTQPLKVDNLYMWTRQLVTMATAEALYGHANPAREAPEFLDDIWTMGTGIYHMVITRFLPSVFAPDALAARARLQSTLGAYYSARHDSNPDVARIVKARADTLRRYGFSDAQIGRFEMAMYHVATANTIPTLFWFLCHVFADPAIIARAREELDAFVTQSMSLPSSGKRRVTINVSTLEARAPFLVSIYRETTRMYAQNVVNRRVMADTELVSATGERYTLKKGADMHLPAEVAHTLSDVWGRDSDEFVADRFLQQQQQVQAATSGKDRRTTAQAFIPFGGGKHLCPGRNFAFAENLAMVLALAVGFEVRRAEDGGPVPVPKSAVGRLGHGILNPEGLGEGLEVNIERRKGWEDVEWRFVSTSSTATSS